MSALTPAERIARAVHDYVQEWRKSPSLIPVGRLHEVLICTVERPLLEDVLALHGRNFSRTARELGINRATLRKRMRELGIR